MEQSLSDFAEYIALIIETVAIAVVAFGAVEAVARLFEPHLHWPPHNILEKDLEEARSTPDRERIEA
jgi:hypothetical protein